MRTNKRIRKVLATIDSESHDLLQDKEISKPQHKERLQVTDDIRAVLELKWAYTQQTQNTCEWE